MPKPEKFWNLFARRYARSPVSDEAAYQTKLAKTQEYFSPEMTVLEFGCGTGSTAIVHAPHVARLDAIDFSENMIAIARDKAAAAGIENIHFDVASIDSFESAPGTYDVVMAHSVLHLLPHKEAAIAKAYDLLKPGGVFVASTVCLAHMKGLFKVIASVGNFLRLLPQVQIFSADDLRRALTDAGFVMDHEWQPGPEQALFTILRKPA